MKEKLSCGVTMKTGFAWLGRVQQIDRVYKWMKSGWNENQEVVLNIWGYVSFINGM
jgi:hypothetical protein